MLADPLPGGRATANFSFVETMDNDNFLRMPRAIMALGAFLAIGLVAGAYVLGMQTSHIGSGRSSVTVKGLAETPVKADLAEWHISASADGATFADALSKLRKEKALLDEFLAKQGFDASQRVDHGEGVEPRFVQKETKNGTKNVQEGYTASQSVVITTKALDRVAAANKAALDYQASGREVSFSDPAYLVSSLEEVKMSLISAATENARKRAGEFIKHSEAQLGTMRSASQGAFYILPNTADAKTDDYGGAYDKSTVDKVARVVVTVEFNLK